MFHLYHLVVYLCWRTVEPLTGTRVTAEGFHTLTEEYCPSGDYSYLSIDTQEQMDYNTCIQTVHKRALALHKRPGWKKFSISYECQR